MNTGRLILRDFGPDDFAAFYATADDPEHRQYYPEHETTEEAYRRIFERIRAWKAKSTSTNSFAAVGGIRSFTLS